MRIAEDASTATLTGFVREVVEPSAVVHTDGWNPTGGSVNSVRPPPRTQRRQRIAADDRDEILPRVHRVISNLKTWLLGKHRGVSKEHLQVYLDEYVFRFNRRRTPMATFQTLLGLGGRQPPRTYRQIYAEDPGGRKPARDPSIA